MTEVPKWAGLRRGQLTASVGSKDYKIENDKKPGVWTLKEGRLADLFGLLLIFEKYE